MSVSPDGTRADVVVEKRVRLLATDATGAPAEQHVRYAWAEVWELRPEGWRMVRITSTDRPGEDPDPAAPGRRAGAAATLAVARTALGGERAARVGTVAFDARCHGPRGRYRTRVLSARDGRVLFEQTFPDRPRFAAGRSLSGGWLLGGDAPPAPLDPVVATVVAAHEFALLALAPESRYRSPRSMPAEELDGRPVSVVRFLDGLDAPADFLYDAHSGLPAGFRIRNHTGRGPAAVLTRWGDWRTVDGVRLPFQVLIQQGDDAYRCEMEEVSTAWIADALFAAPGG